jgi:adenosylhomocysteine nucleosidase
MEDVKNALVVVATEREERALLSNRIATEVTYGRSTKIPVKRFELNQRTVTVARCGVGLVNAGVILTMIVEHQVVDAVLLLGVGGALDEALEVGDVVISRQILQHDSISSLKGGALFIAPGELTLSAAPDQQIDPAMRCDPILVDWLARLFGERTYTGAILSGSEFVANAKRKAELRKLAEDALLVDMEAAALAQVARRLQIPFVAAKTVSDRANPETSISMDYKTFLDAAAARSGRVLQGFVELF